ncbi:MAG: hypothetical protein LBV27_04185 [Oscillospiraceae bacterium]|jgi:hypothetical protein|nr:hypothetical protein [Oscillospiraceae bacterium]
MWSGLQAENYGNFVNPEGKTANFNNGSFATLLETVKQYSEEGYIVKGATGQADAGMVIRQAGDAPRAGLFSSLKMNSIYFPSLP